MTAKVKFPVASAKDMPGYFRYEDDCGHKGKFNPNKIVSNMILRNNGVLSPYRFLSLPAKKALAYYMAIDGEAWELPRDYCSVDLPYEKVEEYWARRMAFIVKYCEMAYGHIVFGYVEIPMDDILEAWRQTHNENHPALADHVSVPRRKETWPVILSGFHDEVLQDGNKRLSDYIMTDVKTVPAIWYPSNQDKHELVFDVNQLVAMSMFK